jgi:flagellar assembly factor FliW
MKMTTKTLGEVELDQDRIIEMSSGMIGFPTLSKYALIAFDDDKAPLFYWQCADEPSVCFILMDPALVFPDYEVALSPGEVEDIELESAADGTVYVVVTIPPDPREMTANLMGPLVINQSARKAKQVVLSDPRYSTRHRILNAEAPGHACADSQN